MSRFSLRVAAGAMLAAGILAACGDSARDGADTPLSDTTLSADTGMAGMDHSTMAMNRPAPRDSNQVFLRMMADHHQGLILMSDSAAAKAQGATARADARQLSAKQQREQRDMLAMLGSQYQDSITPMLMPSNQAMLDSVVRTSGAATDTVYYRQVVHHHREGIAMTEPLLPHLTGESRSMATKMVEDQRRESEEFARKAGGVRATP